MRTFLPLSVLVLLLSAAPRVPASPASAFPKWEKKGLAEFAEWFSDAVLTEGGVLRLAPTAEYRSAPGPARATAASAAFASWREAAGKDADLLEVAHAGGGEVWAWDERRGRAVRFESYDYAKQVAAAPRGPTVGRWFMFGGLQMTAQESLLQLFLNMRLGSFLYRDKIDAALTFDLGMTSFSTPDTGLDDGGSNVNSTTTFGVMGRYHVPLSPRWRVHGGLQWNVTSGGGTSSDYPNVLVGLSHSVGRGTFDVTARLGDNGGGTAGYTLFIK